jgi:hypothetical protein
MFICGIFVVFVKISRMKMIYNYYFMKHFLYIDFENGFFRLV